MERTENRAVTVKYCDFCGEETQNLSKCAVCKKKMCSKEGMKAHAAYAVELYRYGDANRLNLHVCTTCVTATTRLTIRQLFDGMMGGEPVGGMTTPVPVTTR